MDGERVYRGEDGDRGQMVRVDREGCKEEGWTKRSG